MAFKWRKWNNILHRDLGYLAFGLSIVYAISGVAVNHAADWNPNYKIENTERHIKPLDSGRILTDSQIQSVLSQLEAIGEVNNVSI